MKNINRSRNYCSLQITAGIANLRQQFPPLKTKKKRHATMRSRNRLQQSTTFHGSTAAQKPHLQTSLEAPQIRKESQLSTLPVRLSESTSWLYPRTRRVSAHPPPPLPFKRRQRKTLASHWPNRWHDPNPEMPVL